MRAKRHQLLFFIAVISFLSACLKPSREEGSVTPGGQAAATTPNQDLSSANLTYVDFVEPLFAEYCVSCHSANGTPPALVSYDDASIYAEINLELMELPQTDPRYMPPGRAVDPAELENFRQWVNEGTPEQ
ncbi:MAG: c-type cytochrome [Oligoflexus sp.]